MRSCLGTSNISHIAPWVHGAFTIKLVIKLVLIKIDFLAGLGFLSVYVAGKVRTRIS